MANICVMECKRILRERFSLQKGIMSDGNYFNEDIEENLRQEPKLITCARRYNCFRARSKSRAPAMSFMLQYTVLRKYSQFFREPACKVILYVSVSLNTSIKYRFRTIFMLMEGTVTKGEGNSVLLIGPRGTGKTWVKYS